MKTRLARPWRYAVSSAALATAVSGWGLALDAAPAHAASCSPAGNSGLTAALVATSGQTISGQTVDGTGCDIGIYLPPGGNGVTINGVTVSGADNHGIYGQDNDSVTIEGSTVQNNGLKPNHAINEIKAIELDGATNSTIENNTVQNNFADGGIGIDDDGPNSPGALKGGSSTPVIAKNDVISGNQLPNNYGGCDIVAAAYNSGGGLDHVTITGNSIVGQPGQVNPNAGPFIGQIVVANDFPGNSITNTTVSNNTIIGSALAGIVMHANAPGDTESTTVISGNTLKLDHWAMPFGPPQLTGIAIQAENGPPGAVPSIDNTLLQANTISNEYYDVWTKGQVTNTRIAPDNAFSFDPGGTEVFHKPGAWSGYTMVGSDGGAFAFGGALYTGSAANQKPSAPIVGVAPTRDDNGYWMAGADGAVYNFGDADALGSLTSAKVHPKAPIVGIAASQASGAGGIGYYLVGADGGVFTFGDAVFHGSLGNKALAAPIVGIAPTPDDGGYWLVAKDGGVFTFGDAAFFGSLGNKHLNAPIVGMAASPTGSGYTLVASDGGVFTFGDARFYGSAGNLNLKAPVAGIVLGPPAPRSGPPAGPPSPTPAGGYWLVAKDGGVFSYGNANFFGSAGGTHLAAPVVGMTGTI